jgi:hypothetical protein
VIDTFYPTRALACNRVGWPGLISQPVRVTISDDNVEIHLSRAQKIFGLMRDVRVPLSGVSDVDVVAEPLHEAMSSGLKVGIRLPWLYYAARTIKLDRLFVVRRGVPALSFAVSGHPPLKHVLLSTPDAEQLAARLRQG